MKIRPAEEFNAMAPEPGLYENVPERDYRRADAMNFSGTIESGRTPLHFEAGRTGKLARKETAAFRLGSAEHVYILEGEEKFKKEVSMYDGCVALLKQGKNKGKPCGNTPIGLGEDGPVCGSHGGREAAALGDWVSPEEYDMIQRKAARMHSAKVMNQLRRKGYSEFTIVWEQWGHLWKGRLDRCVLDEPAVILDLKRCQVGDGWTDDMGHPIGLQKKVKRYEYHVQAAMYADGLQALTGLEPVFLWVFVEESEPFDVIPLPLDPASKDIGRAIWKQRFDAWQRCKDGGTFWGTCSPEYKFERMTALPSWELRGWNQYEPQEEEWC